MICHTPLVSIDGWPRLAGIIDLVSHAYADSIVPTSSLPCLCFRCCGVSSSPFLCPRHCYIPLALLTPLSPRTTTNYDNNVLCQQTSLCAMKQSPSVNSITAIIVIVVIIIIIIVSTTMKYQQHLVIAMATTAMMSRGWHLLLSCHSMLPQRPQP